MPDITITVRDKIATAEADAAIVCGNNDYTVHFDLDAAWRSYTEKTARFISIDKTTGVKLRHDVLMTNDTAQMPAVFNTNAVFAGVYAGSVIASTPARIPCVAGILDDDRYHADPDTELYDQLLAYLSGLSGTDEGMPMTDELAFAGLDETSIDDVDDWTTAE